MKNYPEKQTESRPSIHIYTPAVLLEYEFKMNCTYLESFALSVLVGGDLTRAEDSGC